MTRSHNFLSAGLYLRARPNLRPAVLTTGIYIYSLYYRIKLAAIPLRQNERKEEKKRLRTAMESSDTILTELDGLSQTLSYYLWEKDAPNNEYQVGNVSFFYYTTRSRDNLWHSVSV